MLMCIIIGICSVVGIYGFYTDHHILLIIGACACILEVIRGFVTGQLKSLSIPLISISAGMIWAYFASYSWWVGACIGVCFETAILTAISLLTVIIVCITGSFSKD